MSTAGEKDCSRPDFRAASLKFLKIVAGLRGAFVYPKNICRVVFSMMALISENTCPG